MPAAFICDAVRTPFGRYGGALASVRPDDLAAIPLRALLARNPRLDAAAIDDVILGCANQAGEDNRNVARMALLLAGLPESVPGVTVNRLCGSGLDAVAIAARMIPSERSVEAHVTQIFQSLTGTHRLKVPLGSNVRCGRHDARRPPRRR